MANSKTYREILQKTYDIYKEKWCDARGYNLSECDEEVGFQGECYACIREFEAYEFSDEECMRHILDDNDYKEWEALDK